MKYVVVVTPEAKANIAAAREYIALHSEMYADKWHDSILAQIKSLEEHPRRFGAAREQIYLSQEVRQFVVKSHRVIFTIDDVSKTVLVIYVRHAKRRAVGEFEEEETE